MLYINISNYAGTHMRELHAHVGGQTLDGQVEGVANVTGHYLTMLQVSKQHSDSSVGARVQG